MIEPHSRRSLVRWSPEQFLWSAHESERAGRPLLVMLHGLGADETDLAALNPYLPPQIVTVSVRAPLLYGDRFAWFDRTRPSDDASADAHDGRRALQDWLRTLAGHTSLGVLGFSQGAAVAVDLLRTEAGLIDYVVQVAGFPAPTAPADAATSAGVAAPAHVVASAGVAVSGTAFDGGRRAHTEKVPVFSGHGDRDHIIPTADAQRLSEWLRHNSDLTEHRYPDAAHEISAEMLDDIVLFLGAHAR